MIAMSSQLEPTPGDLARGNGTASSVAGPRPVALASEPGFHRTTQGVWAPDSFAEPRPSQHTHGSGPQMNAYKAIRNDPGRPREMLRYASADADQGLDLRQLTAVSQSLMRNNLSYRRLVNAVVRLAAHGDFMPVCTPDWEAIEAQLGRAVGDDDRKGFESQVERFWKRSWKRPESSGELDGAAMVRLVLRSWQENGDTFLIAQYDDRDAQPRVAYGRAAHFRWLLIETGQVADQLSHTHTLPTGHTFTSGIEKNAAGQPVALHVWNRHPGEGVVRGATRGQIRPGQHPRSVIRIPWRDRLGRRNVVQVCDIERIGQSRGVPPHAAAMPRARDTDSYAEASLMTAFASAMFMGMIKRHPDNSVTGRTKTHTNDGSDGQKEYAWTPMRPGMLYEGEPGEELDIATPPTPGQSIEQQMNAAAAEMGGGAGLTFESVTGDFRDTNYTSGRASLEMAWMTVRVVQQSLLRTVLSESYGRFLDEGVRRGTITLPEGVAGDATDPFGGYFDAFCACVWIVPSMPRIDKEKELKGDLLAVANHIDTRRNAARRLNNRIEDVLDQLEREAREIRDRELERSYVTTNPGNRDEGPSGGSESDASADDPQPTRKEKRKESAHA